MSPSSIPLPRSSLQHYHDRDGHDLPVQGQGGQHRQGLRGRLYLLNCSDAADGVKLLPKHGAPTATITPSWFKFAAGGASVPYATFLSGTDPSDGSGALGLGVQTISGVTYAFIGGFTYSTTFPVTSGVYQGHALPTLRQRLQRLCLHVSIPQLPGVRPLFTRLFWEPPTASSTP